jgi:allantoate deiminase
VTVPADVDIDPGAIERHLLTLAACGAYEATGVWRPVYSPAWSEAQERVTAMCRAAGLAVKRDAVGNVWGRLEGSAGGPAIVSGSHIDSQLPGGRYDGALGVVAAVVAIQALKNRYGAPKRPLEAVSLCEEEGSRFAGANFWGSRAVTGGIDSSEADTLMGYDGVTMAEAMRAIGLDPAAIPGAERSDVDTFIELHIEQGPLLERAQLPAAVVTAITGLRHYVVDVMGRADHAGAVPMDLRRDPMAGAAEIISGVLDTACAMGRPAVTTVGRIAAHPNYPAIVPERVTFTVDARHPDAAALADLYRRHEARFRDVGREHDLAVGWTVSLDQPPIGCDPHLVAVLKEAARRVDVPILALHSGAGHDTQVMARRCRVAMIFVRSQGGRSHTPAEFTTIEDATAGVRILAAALHALAY